MNQKIERFIKDYNTLSKDTMHLLEQMYHDDVHFIDPLHEIHGLQALKAYFCNLYENVISIEFNIDDSYNSDEHCFLYWTMRYQHRALNSGQTITVHGHSFIQFTGDKVSFHRDYVDIGEMLYEHVPLLGWAVKKIKHRAQA
jgi:hypothetical protein